MKKDGQNFNADKICLIYEYNNNSPLFVRVADILLQEINVNEAISIVEKGLKLHPDYPSAYLVYAKALAIKGDYSKAKEMVNKGSELIDSKYTLDYYLNEIEKISIEHSKYSATVGENFVPDKFYENTEITAQTQLQDGSRDLDLEKLADAVNNAKMPKIDNKLPINLDETEATIDENIIVSETLAGIYLSQKNYEEALSMYKQLLATIPEKADIFREKISEIEKIQRDKKEQ
ncbi:MAG: hypothetical protein A2V66_00575 [Ignavibacteria bacterium RBG_13_36_8]|nr:MAG: hypothetical protein A2V66_00575 [Ignavibacteria bacterium RBG_13_36_8]